MASNNIVYPSYLSVFCNVLVPHGQGAQGFVRRRTRLVGRTNIAAGQRRDWGKSTLLQQVGSQFCQFGPFTAGKRNMGRNPLIFETLNQVGKTVAG